MTTDTTPNPATPGAPTPSVVAPPQTVQPAPATPAPAGIPAPIVVEYAPTGDAALDVALEYIGQQGLGPDSEEVKLATSGDFSKLRAKLGPGGEKFVKLAEQAHAAKVSADKAKDAEILSTVHSAAGGEQTWNAVLEWAGKEATPEQRTEINRVINLGGLAAASLASQLTQEYHRKAPKVGKSAVPSDALSSKGEPQGTMTRADYMKSLATLRGKLGASFEASPQYRELNARYFAGRK